MRQILRPAFWTLLCGLWLALPAGAEHRLVHAPSSADPMQVHLYQLGNGLSVYLSENHQEPRFYAQIAVRAGSKNDPAEATGIAHYLEHMLFKGSTRMGTLDYEKEKAYLDRIEALYEQHFAETDPEKRKQIYAQINQENLLASQYAAANEIQDLYSAMGQKRLNAFTGYDETAYVVDLPANRLRQWAVIESERFAHPVFRLFQTELETVYEEMNQSYHDDKDQILSAAVDRLLFKNHPYGRPIIGTVEHLKNPSIRRMYEFYHTYYVPDNMAVFLSGDLDPGATIALIDSAFSGWEHRELPKPKKWKEEELKAPERVTVTFPGEEYVTLAFRLPPNTHPDIEALEVMDMVLDNRVAGLINLNLNQRQQVREAHAYRHMNNDYGAETLEGVPKQGQSLEEVEKLLLDQLELLKKGEFEEWIIPAIVTDFKKVYQQGFENNNSRVGIMSQAFTSYEDWDRAVHKLDRLAKIEKKDVVRVANKYFKNDNYVAGYRRDGKPALPTIEKPAIDKVEIDPSRHSPFFAEVMGMLYPEIDPVFVVPDKDYQVRQVREGVKLYYCPNPLNDLFSFTISVDLGLLSDKRLSVARDLLDKSGTPHFSAEGLKKEWYRLGTDFGAGSDDYETTLTISGLDGNFSESLKLMVELLNHPAASDSTLRELISITLARREDDQKNHEVISQALFRFNRLGEQSPFRRALSNQQLQQLKKEDLLGLISSLLSYQHTLLYTGSLSIEEVLAQLQQHYVLPTELQSPPAQPPPPIRQPDSTEIYLFDKEMAQALVRIESGDTPYAETLRPAIQIYNEYFGGGWADIVFQELREARGLAYQAWALYNPGMRREEPSLMAGFIGCQVDKTPEALQTFLQLMDDMPASAERFAAARQAQLNLYRTSRLGFRQVLGAVRQWERLGLPVDPRAWRFQQIQQLSFEQMLEFYRGHVQNRPRMISIIGDKRKMDLAVIGAAGPITEVGLPDLFSY